MSSISENRSSPVAAVTSVFEEIREDEEEEMGVAVGDVSERTDTKALAIEDVQEEEEEEGGASGDAGSNSVGISGMEVSNSNTETTVVLQHLLAMSGRSSASSAASSHSSNMAIIEEGEEEEEFYESKDAPLSAKSPTDTFFLPHPIPRLIITDEDQRLVETVVQTTKEYSAGAAQYSPEALLAEEGEESAVLATRL